MTEPLTESQPEPQTENLTDSLKRPFEDYTLAEAFAQFFRAPRRTFSALRDVARAPRFPAGRAPRSGSAVRIPEMPYRDPDAVLHAVPEPLSGGLLDIDALAARAEWRTAVMRVGVYGLALLIFFLGNSLLLNRSPFDPNRLDGIPFTRALPFFLVGMTLVLGLEVWLSLRGGGGESRARRLFEDSPAVHDATGVRWILLPFAAGCAAFAFSLNENNTFTTGGVLMWLAAILLTVGVFLPAGWNPVTRISGLFTSAVDSVRDEWRVLFVVALITLGGAFFRLQNLDATPPEMTSDHMEKLIDAQRVVNGQHDVFFRGNGGREGMQMYLIAAFTALPGVEMNFHALKLLAALEGILTIPVMFFLGRTIAGDNRRIFGTWLGVALALVTAFGYWHVMIGRVALRIILTPLFTSLLLIVFIRALRYNRRVDFIGAGLVLGVSLYTYQATRMLPVLIVIGVALAILLYARSWAERRAYAFNFAVLVVIAFVIFIPLFRFSVDYPNDFWRRSAGRLFGDDLIEEVNDEGILVERSSTLEERLTAFGANAPILGDNIYRALLMFNYRGDLIYLHNAPNFPALDPLAAALYLLGAGLWMVRVVRTRDAVDILIPLALLVMLLPSALSIANPNENPSHTRASGALPAVYLLAAYGLVAVVMPLRRLLSRKNAALLVSAGLLVVLALGMYRMNAYNVFVAYHEEYIDSWKPLSDGGRILREFAQEERGGYGNAFMIAYPHWWDYRIIANEAGLAPMVWQNGDIPRETLVMRILRAYTLDAGDPMRLDPNRDLMFMVAPEDTETSDLLHEWFPRGLETTVQTYKPDISVRIYRVPAMGSAALEAFLREQGLDV